VGGVLFLSYNVVKDTDGGEEFSSCCRSAQNTTRNDYDIQGVKLKFCVDVEVMAPLSVEKTKRWHLCLELSA